MIKVTITDDMQFPICVYLNDGKRKEFTKNAAIELKRKLEEALAELDCCEGHDS